MLFVKDLLFTYEKHNSFLIKPVTFSPVWLYKLASQDKSIAGFLIQFNLKIVNLLLGEETVTPSVLSSPEAESPSWTEQVALLLRQLKPKAYWQQQTLTVQRPPDSLPSLKFIIYKEALS